MYMNTPERPRHYMSHLPCQIFCIGYLDALHHLDKLLFRYTASSDPTNLLITILSFRHIWERSGCPHEVSPADLQLLFRRIRTFKLSRSHFGTGKDIFVGSFLWTDCLEPSRKISIRTSVTGPFFIEQIILSQWTSFRELEDIDDLQPFKIIANALVTIARDASECVLSSYFRNDWNVNEALSEQ